MSAWIFAPAESDNVRVPEDMAEGWMSSVLLPAARLRVAWTLPVEDAMVAAPPLSCSQHQSHCKHTGVPCALHELALHACLPWHL
jgi:hypothetical protein